MAVVLHNKLPQLLTVTILDADGRPVECRIPGYGKSDPIPEGRITAHVRQMIAAGHIRQRTAE
jgi:hypothetical protein